MVVKSAIGQFPKVHSIPLARNQGNLLYYVLMACAVV